MGDGKNLKKYLDEKGTNVRKIAKATGISATTLYSIIQKDSNIRFDFALRLANELQIDVNEICSASPFSGTIKEEEIYPTLPDGLNGALDASRVKTYLKNSMYPLMYLFGKNSMPDVDNLLTSFYQLDDESRQEVVETIRLKLQYHRDPERDTDKPFLMPVEDVFSITGRGTVATGRVERGVLHVSDEVEIVGIKEETRKVVVTGVEMFRKLLDEAQAGDNIGALLRGINRDQIERGQVLAKPGSVTCHKKFTAQVYVLTKDEGGRHTPFFNNYRPQFYFRTTDVTGVCELPEGTEMCMPGDNVEMTIELIHPVAMEQGLRFAIREGGRTVGSGRVATIIE